MCVEETPVVFVVILNWNGDKWIHDAITSVLNQDFPIARLVVVDNASDDGSDKEVERRFPQVTMIRNSVNLGYAAGCNVGIRFALRQGADYVLLLNNDVQLDMSAVSLMITSISADLRRAAVVPKIYFLSPHGEQLIWAAGAQWRRLPPRVTIRGYRKLDMGQYDQPGTVDYATGCVLLVRRQAFEVAGLLDESYFMYHEDYAFCDCVRAEDLVLWYEPRAIAHHLVSASTGEGSPDKWRYWFEGVFRFYVQHYGNRWWAIWPAVVFMLWVVARESVKRRAGWICPMLQGLWSGWIGWCRVRSD